MSDTFYLDHKMTRKRLPVGAYTVTCTCGQLPTLAMYNSLYANAVERAHLTEIKAQHEKGSE